MPFVSIDPALRAKCPQVVLGCVRGKLQAAGMSAALEADLSRAENRIGQLPEPRAVLESRAIIATRSAYKALGKDPARYRGSAEALLRRILSGKPLPRISNVVDIINLVSVESRYSIGLYDLSRVQGTISFRAGRQGETYKGIGKYDLNLEGLPVFADDLGPHGSPTSDSERTMFTEATKSVLAVVISFGGPDGLETACRRLRDLFVQYAGAESVEIEIVE